MSDKIKLRKLAWKSTLNFGRHADLTVAQVFDLSRRYLVWVYYHSSNVTFLPEILEALHIRDIHQIPKAGKNPEMMTERANWCRDNLGENRPTDEQFVRAAASHAVANMHKKSREVFRNQKQSAYQMARRNQGKKP